MAYSYLNFALTDEEIKIFKEIKDIMGFERNSDTFRAILKLIRLFYDDNLTMERALKPYFIDLLKKGDSNIYAEVPIFEMFKTIPQLEKELNGDQSR